MKVHLYLRQVVVGAYLLLTASALLYTLTRITLPLFPSSVIHYSYGMMAPYQGDNEWNDMLIALGEFDDGTVMPINLTPYYPYGFGETNVRMYLRSFSLDDLRYHRKYTELASQLLAHERERGNMFHTVRLYRDTWPRSPEGFFALHYDPFIKRAFLTEAE